jgi:Contractile injection system tube protein/LysM domain
MPDAPTKAYISLIPPNSAGGPELGRVTFDYNPKELSFNKAAQWQRKPAKGAKKAATPEFQGPSPMSLTVELFLDGYEAGRDVSKDIETLYSCCHPMASSLQSKKPSPPWVVFGWGSNPQLTAIVKSVAVKLTMFKNDGTPLRAICTVSMEEVVPDSFAQNPTSGSLNSVRSHLMVEGDSLPSVAYKQYGNAGWWRPLAEANGIDDPLKVSPGTRILVPDIDDAFNRAI